mgnify:FL=1
MEYRGHWSVTYFWLGNVLIRFLHLTMHQYVDNEILTLLICHLALHSTHSEALGKAYHQILCIARLS